MFFRCVCFQKRSTQQNAPTEHLKLNTSIIINHGNEKRFMSSERITPHPKVMVDIATTVSSRHLLTKNPREIRFFQRIFVCEMRPTFGRPGQCCQTCCFVKDFDMADMWGFVHCRNFRISNHILALMFGGLAWPPVFLRGFFFAPLPSTFMAVSSCFANIAE